MKGILKEGPVAVWFIGEEVVVMAEESATDWDLLQAMDAEEELNLYREKAETN